MNLKTTKEHKHTHTHYYIYIVLAWVRVYSRYAKRVIMRRGKQNVAQRRFISIHE